MALPSLSFRIPQSEINRIRKELEKVQALVDPSFRGASAGSVTRYALNRTGTVARKILRNSTPRASGELRSSVKGKIFKTKYGLSYRAGWTKRLVVRFQKPLAIEFGTKHRGSMRVVSGALTKAAGSNAKKLAKVFLEQLDKRISTLAAKANARARIRKF